MSDTPRTDAKESETERGCYINGRSDREGWERHAHYGWKHARALEHELAAVKAERDEAIAWMRVVGEEIAIAGHRSGDRAETLAGLRCLREERDRMRPVVEAAQKWRHAPMDSVAETNALNMIVLSVSTYEAATCPSATEMP